MGRKLKFLGDERGQLFSGYLVGIFAVVAVAAAATTSFIYQKRQQDSARYRDWATNMANLGFENAVSYFKNDPLGRYLPDSIAPLNQNWTPGNTSNPWKAFPDLAFAPLAVDTDYWSLSVAAGVSMRVPIFNTSGATSINGLDNTVTARAMIRTIPLNYFNSATSVADVRKSRYWGRFVVKRQLTRNWSPGPNTYAAFTDEDAVHDLSHLRSNVRPGSGTIWSIVSSGYIFTWPSDVTDWAAHEGGSLLNPPLAKYQGKPLLLAKAKVYGEITRVNVNTPPAAVWVNNAASVSVLCNGAVIARGSGNYSIGSATGTAPTVSTGCSAPNTNGTTIYGTGVRVSYSAPSLANAFPGQSYKTLKSVALSLNPAGVGTDSSVFPDPGDADFEDQASRNTFYFIEGNATLAGTVAARRMTGIGVVVVTGNLTINAGNPSEFSGIVYVGGNVVLGPGVGISGILITPGTVSLGATGSTLKAQLEFNQDAIDNAKDNILRSFQVITSNVITAN